MMMLAQNLQKMYYALLEGKTPIYQRDADGNVQYCTGPDGAQIPIETGETELSYTVPIEFYGNISLTGSSAESVAAEYGIDTSEYDATLIVDRGALPITETSLVWHTSEAGLKDEPVVGKAVVGGDKADPQTADYRVLAVKDSLVHTKYILGRITKNGTGG